MKKSVWFISGGLLVAFLLYAWQFPHFNSLSWNIRQEYGRAGYKMMCVTHERLCVVTSLRYSVMILLASSIVAPAIDMTTWLFAVDSLPVNAYFVYLSYQFYRQRDAQSSRKLFRYSLIHLPLLFTLMVLHRQMKSEPQAETSSTNEQIPVPMWLNRFSIVDVSQWFVFSHEQTQCSLLLFRFHRSLLLFECLDYNCVCTRNDMCFQVVADRRVRIEDLIVSCRRTFDSFWTFQRWNI